MSTSEHISLTQVANAILRRRHRILRACLSTAGLVLLVSVALGREFSSELRFVPDSGTASIGALSGLAAQFGFAGALGGGGQSPDFYVSLTKSRTILGAIADTTFRFTRRQGILWWSDTVEVVGTVAELYKVDRPKNRERERDETIELLGDLVTASASLETGIVTVRATTDWPHLSFAIAKMIADRLSHYSVETMQTRASEERRFVDERLVAQRAELAVEEDSLRQFLENNRAFTASPQLLLEHDRLQRKIALRQQIVIGLAQAYEQSRIEEVRNTPVLTVMQSPEIPAKAVRRYLALKLIAAFIFAFAFMLAVAVVQERSGRELATPEAESADLAMLTAESIEELRQLVPFLRKRDRQSLTRQ